MKYFTEQELEHFNIIIENNIEECKKNISDCEEAMLKNSEFGGINKLDEVEQSNSFNMQILVKNRKRLSSLKQAQFRIKNKTFGICQRTGELINKKRLELVPETTINI